MRFLHIRPAVWAMISCSFSSFTRNVAFGSNSVTTPGNSKSSSFAIRYLSVSEKKGARRRPKRRKLAESPPSHNWRVGFLTRSPAGVEGALSDPPQQLIAHISIRVQALLAAACDRRLLRRRPVLQVGR